MSDNYDAWHIETVQYLNPSCRAEGQIFGDKLIFGPGDKNHGSFLRQRRFNNKMAVNEYLERKWRNVFQFRDTTGDGCLSKEDFELASQKLVEKNGLSGEKAQGAKDRLAAGWKDYYDYFGGNKTELTENDFLTASREMFNTRGDAWREAIKSYASGCFDVVDNDANGLMTVDELDVYYQSYGVNNRQFVEDVFRQIDSDGNGSISREEFIDAHVNYFFDTAEGKDIPVLFDVGKARS